MGRARGEMKGPSVRIRTGGSGLGLGVAPYTRQPRPWPGRSKGAGGKQRRAAFRKRKPLQGGGSQKERCGGAEEQPVPEEGPPGMEP